MIWIHTFVLCDSLQSGPELTSGNWNCPWWLGGKSCQYTGRLKVDPWIWEDPLEEQQPRSRIHNLGNPMKERATVHGMRSWGRQDWATKQQVIARQSECSWLGELFKQQRNVSEIYIFLTTFFNLMIFSATIVDGDDLQLQVWHLRELVRQGR